jgi:transcription initiation factor TFIIIB Brf1 subunit/transcription initiation factor TFIIB
MDFELSTMTPKSQSSSTNTVLGRTKRKSPTNAYPISCLRCSADNDEFIRADFEAKTVICKKCSHVAAAEDYSNEDFVRACLYDKKESGSGGGTVKRHQETAYYSVVADLNRTTNERAMIALRDAENQRAANLEDRRMQHQEKLFESQAKLLDRILPKKSSVEAYRENKAAVTQMLAAGEIDQEEAEDLYNKLKADFLSSKTI